MPCMWLFLQNFPHLRAFFSKREPPQFFSFCDGPMEQLRVIKSKQFGSKSEKASEQVEEQLSLLFD